MKKQITGIIALTLIMLAGSIGCAAPADDTKTELEIGVSGLVALTGKHIQDSVRLLEVLAMSAEVESGNWETMLPLLTKADQVMDPGTKWFVLPDGSYYVVGQGKIDKNLSDRAYFPIVMSGTNAVGELVVTRSSGIKAMVAVVPVKRDGEVIGGLGTSLFLADLSDIVAAQLELPDNMVFAAVTPDNELALHSDAALIMEAATEIDGAACATSEVIGWRFALGYK